MAYPEKTARNEEIFRLIESGATIFSSGRKIQFMPQQNLADLQFCRQKKVQFSELKI